MAKLPSERFLIQQIDGQVVLFENYTEREIVRFYPSDSNATAQAQKTIYDSELSDEDKCFAHFWSGYFYAHASNLIVDEGHNRIKTPEEADELDKYKGDPADPYKYLRSHMD